MAVKNDPKVTAKLLRACAGGTDAKKTGHDLIFMTAADMLDPPNSDAEPLFYVRGKDIFQRPVTNAETRNMSLGFRVCTVADFTDENKVCEILNRGEPATE